MHVSTGTRYSPCTVLLMLLLLPLPLPRRAPGVVTGAAPLALSSSSSALIIIYKCHFSKQSRYRAEDGVGNFIVEAS